MPPVPKMLSDFFSQHVIVELTKLVVIAAVVGLGGRVWQNILERRGWLTGEWTQVIEQFNERAAKEDLIVCRHRRKRVMATIKRVAPEQERYKKWRFEGALREDGSLVGFFLGTEANSDSYGVIFLRKIDQNKSQGHYTRLLGRKDQRSQTAQTEIVRREQIRLTWTRIEKRGIVSRITSYLKT